MATERLRQRLRGATAVMMLLMLASAGCRPSPPARSVVLVTLDTTRADHLGPYGYAGARTPTLDRLAAEGTVYTRAYSPVPETLPTHTSMLTGLYPPSHGVRLNLSFRLPPGAVTLAELLRRSDFWTAAITAAGVLDARYGLDQGFQFYADPPVERRPRESPAEEVTRRALAAAEAFGKERFFLWAHYYDPHSPYEPRAPFAAPDGAAPESVELYDLEIAYMDSWVDELLRGLDERGQLAGAVVVVAGDHGESLGEHGETYHTLFVYEATQHVPLIVSGAGLPSGQRVEELVTPVDLFATVLRLAGVEPPSATSSRPLPGLGLGESADSGRRAIFSESMAPPLRFGWAGLQAVRLRDWLYIRAPTEELYDLAADPGQQVNLASTEDDLLVGMRGLLGDTLSEMPAADWGEEVTHQPSDAELRALEALGYLATQGEDPLAQPLQGEDPKDLVEVSEAFQLARLARRLDRPETAEELLRFVVTADPGNFGGWHQYGQFLFAQRRFEESLAALAEALKLRPSNWQVLVQLAAAERALGDTGAAEWHLGQALRTSPFPGEVWRERARLRATLGDWNGAAAAYRKVLEHEPGDRRAAWALGQIEAGGFLDPEAAPGAETADPSADVGPG